MDISNIVSLLEARQSRPSTPATVEGVANPAHAQLLPFRKRAHVHASKAQRVAHLAKAGHAQHMNGDSKTAATPAGVSEAAVNNSIRLRIDAVATTLNLSAKAIRGAMSLKHERLAAFAQKFGVNIEWLVAGTGRVFWSREPMLDLAVEFERRLALQLRLKAESTRRWNISDRVRYRILGVDPDDKKACEAASRSDYDAWLKAREAAEVQTGYHEAWREWNNASRQTKRIALEIFKVVPHASVTGFLIRMRVLSTTDIFRKPPDAAMVDEIRAFSGRWHCAI